MILELVVPVFTGLVLLIIQQAYQNNKKKKSISSASVRYGEKTLGEDFLTYVRPGINLKLVTEQLGEPLKKDGEDSPIYSETTRKTLTQIYIFKNLELKLSSADSVRLDSITIIASNKRFNVEQYLSHFNTNSTFLRKARVNEELIKATLCHTICIAKHDFKFALTVHFGNPFYETVTFFGDCMDTWRIYNENQDPKVFLNHVIDGICISKDTEEVYCIFRYEIT